MQYSVYHSEAQFQPKNHSNFTDFNTNTNLNFGRTWASLRYSTPNGLYRLSTEQLQYVPDFGQL